jgi:hypothetical protein
VCSLTEPIVVVIIVIVAVVATDAAMLSNNVLAESQNTWVAEAICKASSVSLFARVVVGAAKAFGLLQTGAEYLTGYLSSNEVQHGQIPLAMLLVPIGKEKVIRYGV